MQSGYILRDVLDKVNEIHFSSSEEIHTLEPPLRVDAQGDARRRRRLRRVLHAAATRPHDRQGRRPKPGETVLDPAAGTGGFLVEAYEHLRPQCEDRSRTSSGCSEAALFGIEAKPLPYLLCQMNLLLHGVESPHIDPLNALRFRMSEIGDRDRVDVIVTNPPFGGEEERGIQRNFPDDRQTSETALLFLQLIMRKLRRPGHGSAAGGRASSCPTAPCPATALPRGSRRSCWTNFNLHTVVRLPNGVFAPYTPIPTNVLFFDRSGPTNDIWYYEHPLPEGRKNYTKTGHCSSRSSSRCSTGGEREWKQIGLGEFMLRSCVRTAGTSTSGIRTAS